MEPAIFTETLADAFGDFDTPLLVHDAICALAYQGGSQKEKKCILIRTQRPKATLWDWVTTLDMAEATLNMPAGLCGLVLPPSDSNVARIVLPAASNLQAACDPMFWGCMIHIFRAAPTGSGISFSPLITQVVCHLSKLVDMDAKANVAHMEAVAKTHTDPVLRTCVVNTGRWNGVAWAILKYVAKKLCPECRDDGFPDERYTKSRQTWGYCTLNSLWECEFAERALLALCGFLTQLFSMGHTTDLLDDPRFRTGLCSLLQIKNGWALPKVMVDRLVPLFDKSALVGISTVESIQQTVYDRKASDYYAIAMSNLEFVKNLDSTVTRDPALVYDIISALGCSTGDPLLRPARQCSFPVQEECCGDNSFDISTINRMEHLIRVPSSGDLVSCIGGLHKYEEVCRCLQKIEGVAKPVSFIPTPNTNLVYGVDGAGALLLYPDTTPILKYQNREDGGILDDALAVYRKGFPISYSASILAGEHHVYTALMLNKYSKT
jgi:hypothetical protein